MKVEGGYILLARKILDSEIMSKPPLHFKLWGWMLLQAKFNKNSGLERGQFKTSIKEMQEAMTYNVGYRKQRPSIKKIRGVYESLTKGSMIGTMKVTGGLVITILNYCEYQDPKNYEGHSEGVHEGKSRGTSYNKKNDKNEILTGKNALDFFAPDINGWNKTEFEKTINGLISLRKTKRISHSVVEKEVEFWQKFPDNVVNNALVVYTRARYWEKSKGERYLRGIIRGKMKEHEKQSSQSLSKKAF
jgi:hypothetical protein